MNAQLPAHLQNRQSRNLAAQAIGGISAGSPAHISIAGNRFTLVDEAGNEKPIQTLYLDVCVIDANAAVSKVFFDPRVPFEPGGDNSNPPICWSDNGIGASAQASQPQHTSCSLCPQNAWGSATSKATGKPVKACNDVKKVAVIVPGIDMVFLLRIPPASLKNWGKYCGTLAGAGVDLPDALTRLEFESQGILKFQPTPVSNPPVFGTTGGTAYVDGAVAAMTDKFLAMHATDQLVGRNDRPWTGPNDAAKIAYAQGQGAQNALAPPYAGAPTAQSAPAFAPAAPPAQPMTPPPQPFGAPATAPVFGQAPPPAAAFGGAPAPAAPFGQLDVYTLSVVGSGCS